MQKKPNILVVGSFMMDLLASTKRAPNSGETVIGLKFQTAPGGKGANQAVQCARLGAHVTMVGQVGDDAFGKIMTDTAAAAGVDVSHVSVDPQESSGVGHITLEVTEAAVKNSPKAAERDFGLIEKVMAAAAESLNDNSR